MPRIIQFLHPALEALPASENDNVIKWNNHESHRRKFILSKGEYLSKINEANKCELVFWGEWEPQSDITQTNSSQFKTPKYINSPFLNPSVPERHHTTDPYVFGSHFRYMICMQRAFHNVLVDMPVGSIILFGSSINRNFCLDTLFVVSDKQINYTINTISEVIRHSGRNQYFYATIDPILRAADSGDKNQDESCRLPTNTHCTYYEGVMFNERMHYNGMYSFVPCKTYKRESASSSLFNQPIINLNIFKGTQTQGIAHKEVSIEEIKEIWNEVRRQVADQNLLEGLTFVNPPLKH